MHIFGQKEVVHQTLDDTAPLALFPYSYTGGRGERFTVKLEGRLPLRRCLGGRRYIRPDLDCWPPDDNARR